MLAKGIPYLRRAEGLGYWPVVSHNFNLNHCALYAFHIVFKIQAIFHCFHVFSRFRLWLTLGLSSPEAAWGKVQVVLDHPAERD